MHFIQQIMNLKLYRLLLILILFICSIIIIYSGYTVYEPIESNGMILQKKFWELSIPKLILLCLLIILMILLILKSVRKERN